MPKFSIIIPVYNVAPYLRECLDSVLAQTFTDWEAICVDDGSTDGSGAILDEYAVRDGRFRVIHQVNAGVSAARNAALDVANGEYICFLDGDDVLRANWLRRIHETVVANPGVDWIRTGYLIWREGDAIKSTTSPNIGAKEDGDEASRTLWREVSYWGMPFLNVCRREAIGQTRFNPNIACREDALFCLEAAHTVRSIAVTDIAEYNYRQREGSAFLSVQSRDSGLKFQMALNDIWRQHGGSSAAFTRLASKNFIHWLRRCDCRTRRDVQKVLSVMSEARAVGAFRFQTLARAQRIRWMAYRLTGIPWMFWWGVRDPIKSIFNGKRRSE